MTVSKKVKVSLALMLTTASHTNIHAITQPHSLTHPHMYNPNVEQIDSCLSTQASHKMEYKL